MGFTVDMKSLKPELQLAQHSSLHAVAMNSTLHRKLGGDEEVNEGHRFGQIIEDLTTNRVSDD